MARSVLIAINLLGGIAVLGSYAHGLAKHPELRSRLWGELPSSLMPLYGTCMVLATVGYFAFTPFFLLKLDHSQLWKVNAAYAGVLFPSALWLPLTISHLLAASDTKWMLIRAVLFAAGLCSLLLMWLLVRGGDHGAPWFHRAAMAGLAAFCTQTALLDALVWPHHFPK